MQRVTRPRGGINRWLHWLPVSVHKMLDSFVRRLWGNSRFQMSNHKVSPFSTEKIGMPITFSLSL